MKKRDFLKSSAAVATGLAIVQPASAQTSISWKMATGWGGGPLMDIGAKAFAEKIELITGGRFKVEVFPGGALGNALKVPETVKNGIAECGHTWMGYDWGKDPTTVLFGGYAGSFDTERMLHWLYQAGGVEMQRQFRQETAGIISFPLGTRTAEAFLHSRKPVRTLADLKGLKMRTAGAWLEMAKDLGAAPVTTPGAEVYPMLERGAIDATEWGTMYENISMGFHKIAKYIIYPGVHQPTAPFELTINEESWAKLSPTDQKLVETAARLVTLDFWLKVGQEDAKALDFYKKAGNTLIELSPEVQYAARDIGLKWADKTVKEGKYPWFAKVLESQKEMDALWKGASAWRTVKVR